MFPDCAGNVDVVSDAENIKKLLKLPFQKNGVVSMMVHKVGNTLLLDEFDIMRYIIRHSDVEWKWLRKFLVEHILAIKKNIRINDKTREAVETKSLLSKFLYHSLKYKIMDTMVDTNKPLPRPTPALPNMEPVLPEPKIDENMPDPQSQHTFNRNVLWTFEDIRMLIGTDMPIFGGPNRPCISLRLRDIAQPINVLTGVDYWLDNLMCNVPEVLMCYHLDGIVQKYEIIKTEDLPHLENSQFSPQVIRNVAQNILAFLKVNATKAGHTYWLFKGLDDDVVKLYDLTTLCQIDTATPTDPQQEDTAENRQNPFTVPVGMLLYSVARNMKNCVERVSPKRAGTIRSLLTNCINLLPREKYPQIVTSSHYILADLYLPVGTDPKAPIFEQHEDSNDEWDDDVLFDNDFGDDEDKNDTTHTKVSNKSAGELFKNGAKAATPVSATVKEFDEKAKDYLKAHKKAPSPLKESIQERWSNCLRHICSGLECLQFFDENEEIYLRESEERAKQEEKKRIIHEEQNPNMAKSGNPIPLPYISLQNDKKQAKVKKPQAEAAINDSTEKSRISVKNIYDLLSDQAQLDLQIEKMRNLQREKKQAVVSEFNTQQFGSWNAHLKLLLLEKACLAFATKAEFQYTETKYGNALRSIHMAIRCQHVLNKFMKNEACHKGLLLARAGDCFFQMFKNGESEVSEYQQEEIEEEKCILDEIQKDFDEDLERCLITPVDNLEKTILSSIQCYKFALEFGTPNENNLSARNELLRRLGNAYNEIGLKYMHWAQEEHRKFTEFVDDCQLADSKEQTKQYDVSSIYMHLAIRSYEFLNEGINIFKQCNDHVNAAFLYCNMGRYMRFRAHLTDPRNDEMTPGMMLQMKHFYQEAAKNYEMAQEVLQSRKLNTELWDLVQWELSSATFNLAKNIQDTPVAIAEHNAAEAGKLILELLQKSLSLCNVPYPHARQILYTYRSGLIHKRIAAHHYQHLRGKSLTNQQFKVSLLLCQSHYEKSIQIFDELGEYTDLMVVQLERISLFEYLFENAQNTAKKVKYLHDGLDYIFRVIKTLKKLLTAVSLEDDKEDNNSNDKLDNDEKSHNDYSKSNESLKQTLVSLKFDNYLKLYETRTQFILKNLVKTQMGGKDPKKMADVYKQMYMKALKDGGSPKIDVNLHRYSIVCIIEHTKNIINLMQILEDMYKNPPAQK